jgi:ABC-2 type transport system permease protein
MTELKATTDREIPQGHSAVIALVEQDLRDLWLSGRGLVLLLAHTVLLSVICYLIATNQELNFLEQREAVSLLVQVTVAVGGLLVVLTSADAVSGERERGTLETLLLTPASRRWIVVAAGVATMSLWLAAFLISLPYLWWIGRDVGTFPEAAVGTFVTGTLLALIVTALGLLVSTFSQSNGLSLGLTFFILLALYAPSQLPAEASRGWAGELLLRIDPFTAGLTYLDRLVIGAHPLTQDVSLLLVPALLALALPTLAWWAAGRLSLMPRWGAP